MKCPICEATEKRSFCHKVFPAQTLLAHQPHWDEDGNYHDHNPNCHGEHFACSLGHRWTIAHKCPVEGCNWGADFERKCLDEIARQIEVKP